MKVWDMEYITNIIELLSIRKKGDYKITCDIDCKGQSIKCISEDFSGKLDGSGHRIYNLRLHDKIWGDEQKLALFWDLGKAEIFDITFDKISVEYNRECYNPRVAALAVNCSNSIISNVAVHIRNTANLPLFYDMNDCKIQNAVITINGKPGFIAKYK